MLNYVLNKTHNNKATQIIIKQITVHVLLFI